MSTAYAKAKLIAKLARGAGTAIEFEKSLREHEELDKEDPALLRAIYLNGVEDGREKGYEERKTIEGLRGQSGHPLY